MDAVDVDVIVVGTGQAGPQLATRLAARGKRVVIAERSAVGGTCINYGCTPTKTLIASAAAAHQARTAGRLGVHVTGVRADITEIADRVANLVHLWREGVERGLSEAKGVTLVRGHARFTGPNELEIAGQRYRAGTIILNVGARPRVPPIAGLESVRWFDNHRLLDLRVIPEHLIVIGAGHVGCELGQAHRRLGAEVTMVDPGHHLLGHVDDDICGLLEDVFRGEGIAVEVKQQVQSVSAAGGSISVRLDSGKTLTGSHVLVSTGRVPNTDDLGCDRAGLKLDAHGFVEIDDRYQTSVPGVYAVGDCTGEPQFTHTSWDDHRILFDLLTGASQRGRGGRHIPWVAFTDPQVAGVGLTERDANRQGIAYELAKMPFEEAARAREVDLPAGVLKVLLDPKTERILGAELMGAEAGELLHILVPLMQAGVSARTIVDAEFAHPTFAEAVQSAVMRLDRYRLH